ncbi:MAG: serine/threonine-protein kinase [Polyangia bacterium]
MAVVRSLHAAGQLLSGTYQLERKIAEGGMGVVYEASHLRLARRFAVKLLARAEDEDEDEARQALERFKREAEMTAALKSPHVVEIFDYQISESGSPYIVMELLEGEDLARRLKRDGRVEPRAAVAILEQVAEALDAAHGLAIVHRDLKPANVFLHSTPSNDFVKVLDFGISKMLGWETITQTDTLIGTPAYMSPEQAAPGSEVTSTSDLFSLGVIAYEVLTGVRPFVASSIPGVLYQVVHADPLPVSELVPEAGPAVDDVFARALAKEPLQRFRSATAFVTALRGALWPLEAAEPDADLTHVLVTSEARPTVRWAAATTDAALTTPRSVSEPPQPAPRREVRVLIVAAGVLLVIGLTTFALEHERPKPGVTMPLAHVNAPLRPAPHQADASIRPERPVEPVARPARIADERLAPPRVRPVVDKHVRPKARDREKESPRPALVAPVQSL